MHQKFWAVVESGQSWSLSKAKYKMKKITPKTDFLEKSFLYFVMDAEQAWNKKISNVFLYLRMDADQAVK